jgi:hypothetical protein
MAPLGLACFGFALFGAGPFDYSPPPVLPLPNSERVRNGPPRRQQVGGHNQPTGWSRERTGSGEEDAACGG